MTDQNVQHIGLLL